MPKIKVIEIKTGKVHYGYLIEDMKFKIRTWNEAKTVEFHYPTATHKYEHIQEG